MKLKTTILASIFACSSLLTFADAVATTTECAAECPAPATSLSELEVLAPVFEKFSASLTAGYESEYIFRGKELSAGIATAAADISYDIGAGFGAYAGWWGAYGVDEDYTENDLYTGVTYDIADFSFDVGYLAYLYPSPDLAEHEMKLGVSYDTTELLGDFAVNPYFAAYYQFTHDGMVYEAGLSHSLAVTEWASIDTGVYMGYVDSDLGAYFYTGFSLDASVAINEYCGLSVGMRYAYNNQNYDDDNSNLWFGCSTSIGF